jgi:hypothetical protein
MNGKEEGGGAFCTYRRIKLSIRLTDTVHSLIIQFCSIAAYTVAVSISAIFHLPAIGVAFPRVLSTEHPISTRHCGAPDPSHLHMSLRTHSAVPNSVVVEFGVWSVP